MKPAKVGARPSLFQIVVLFYVLFFSFCVLFVCKCVLYCCYRTAVGTVGKVLCYKLEGRWFDLTNEYQGYFLEVKATGS